MRKLLFSVLSITLSSVCLSSNSHATSESSQLFERAKECTQVIARIERLKCFDEVFATPVESPVVNKERLPEQWVRAMESFSDSVDELPLVLKTQGEEKQSNAWVALRAQNDKTAFEGNDKPILMMSCIDNLSRVELIFPEAVSDPRIKLSVAYGPTQYWRSDDSGLLFSSARGLPAIEMMKAMAKEKRLVLRSNAAIADGLKFDSTELKNSLSALRYRCGW
ncbi:type VI secretion system-associated protein VasI [Vibrio sp. NTOU-M3]|uniref:type VI secretion system-associated protein VasI n=1 Tax=unclassified Vibrio TaxID=2614977 RepID=UPI00349F2773